MHRIKYSILFDENLSRDLLNEKYVFLFIFYPATMVL